MNKTGKFFNLLPGKLIFIGFIQMISSYIFAQVQDESPSKFRLIQPTGKYIDELPEMNYIPDTSGLYSQVSNAIDSSFMGEAIYIYELAQNYLFNQGKLPVREPAYIAVTENQGGYARKGFVLNENQLLTVKKDGLYVDIHRRAFGSDLNELMSLTQLYPHELAHCMLMLLSSNDTIGFQHYNVTMHFFSLLTDYRTAFNEGFAESMENVSRLNEKNAEIKNGIFSDIEKYKASCPDKISGFNKDMKWPFRLGYYKASMLLWYQKYEDFKRYEDAISGIVANKYSNGNLKNPADMITFRNAGIQAIENVKRNQVQLMMCEGFISSFFTSIIQSDLPDHFLQPGFYTQFLKDTTAVISTPKNHFTRVQNQMMKYFHVLHKHVLLEQSEQAQLIDFIDGYCSEYPEEAETMIAVYEKLSGQKYSNQLPPQCWMMVKNFPHRQMVFDAVGSATVPIYTFDINAAEPEDFMTIKGLSGEEAAKIIAFREKNGLFKSYDQVESIPGLNQKTIALLQASTFDASFLNGLEDSKLNITNLILNPLWYLLKRGIVFFILTMLVMYFFFLKRSSNGFSQNFWIMIRYFFIWILLISAGLAVAVFNKSMLPWFWLLLIIMLLTGTLTALKNMQKMKRFATVFFLMGCFVVYSIL